MIKSGETAGNDLAVMDIVSLANGLVALANDRMDSLATLTITQ